MKYVPKKMDTVFKLGCVIYVPHYAQKGYAYPGIGKWDPAISADRLIKAGAKPETMHLYPSYARDSQ